MNNAQHPFNRFPELKTLKPSEITQLIEALQDRKESLVYEDRKRVRELLINAAQAEGYSLTELFGSNIEKATGVKFKKGAPKYRNPSNEEQTWTGHGMRPKWFTAAVAAGVSPDAMLIG